MGVLEDTYGGRRMSSIYWKERVWRKGLISLSRLQSLRLTALKSPMLGSKTRKPFSFLLNKNELTFEKKKQKGYSIDKQ